jgi:predicted DNA-binding transcriptional regulator YafY
VTAYVAGKFEVSDRTIRRDIEYIRDRLSIDIQYSKSEDAGYFISEDERLYLVRLFQDEKILFLSLLKSICKNSFLFPIDIDLVSKALNLDKTSSSEMLTDRISYEMSEEKKLDFSLFNILIKSIEKKKQLWISYSDLNGTESKRIIEPQYLRNSDGQWYLLAFCHNREEMRVFHLSRIGDWELLDVDFVNTVELDEILEVFDSSFGIMTGTDDLKRVSILFKNRAARIVKGKKWHRDQNVEETDLGVVISFPVHSYEEVLNTVFSYNSDAEVLEPPDFRELWKNKISEMAEIYL